jgi:hypothetical protein
VAPGAGPQALIEGLVFEMAQKAGAGGHRHVAPLHDLAVATRTAQLFAATQVVQVRRMVEGNPIEINFTGQQSRLVTA